jgi:hypothetical protein
MFGPSASALTLTLVRRNGRKRLFLPRRLKDVLCRAEKAPWQSNGHH